jgi:ankyrin repeat protein
VLCSRVSSVDIPDSLGRTPLYLACLAGRNNGETDAGALRRCLLVLLAMQADPNTAPIPSLPSPAQMLAGSWLAEPLEVLLDAGADCHTTNPATDGYSALHYACAALPLRPLVPPGTYSVILLFFLPSFLPSFPPFFS